jgi:hypothetical protein
VPDRGGDSRNHQQADEGLTEGRVRRNFDALSQEPGQGVALVPKGRGISGWIGVDLDGTLAHYDVWKGPEHIGDQVVNMLERIKTWIENGNRVKIFTAVLRSRTYPVRTRMA